jgi:hypothetical protein
LSAGPGAKGERCYDWVGVLLPVVEERDGDEPTRRRWMPARRSITDPEDIACFPAGAPSDAALTGLARIAGCRWKIEECFQSAKNECGLDEYEVRRCTGWYRHITLAMPAHAFLAAITAPEREGGPGDDTPDLVDLAPAEIRRLLAAEPPHHPARHNHTLTWSRWRRRHQARARQSRYERRGHLFAGARWGSPSHPPGAPPHSTPPGR